MNILKRQNRDLEIAEFLCTEVGTKKSGKPRYKTLQEASEKYDLSFSHTSRLKTAMVNEIDGIRSIKVERMPKDEDQSLRAMEYFTEKEANEKSSLFQKARNLKSLKVLQLKELIEKTIKDKGYADLQFGKPEIDQFVIIDFTVNDTKDNRNDYESSNGLKKLIKSALEDTNWRLMSEEIIYRLGILVGKLKAYEREDDLLKLVEEDKEKDKP